MRSLDDLYHPAHAYVPAPAPALALFPDGSYRFDVERATADDVAGAEYVLRAMQRGIDEAETADEASGGRWYVRELGRDLDAADVRLDELAALYAAAAHYLHAATT